METYKIQILETVIVFFTFVTIKLLIKYFVRMTELEESEWKELWDILKGPDYSKFERDKDWENLYDGSGLSAWWD